MTSQATVRVSTSQRTCLVDVTEDLQRALAAMGGHHGVCLVFCPHTTAGVTINEGYDPDVARDILATLERMVPVAGQYRHAEGNADAHVKATLVGCSALLGVEGGRLVLGRWQRIFFCEFDGPRQRELWLRFVGE